MKDSSNRRWQERGQSLVETAIALPIFLIIIAGLVEISNLIISQSRLDTATRTATRFGGQGGVDEGIRLSMLQAVTPTLDLDPDLWDVYIIRAEVNSTGNDYVSGTWRLEHAYGNQITRPITDLNEAQIQQEVLSNLKQDTGVDALASEIEIVAVMAFHDIPAILGLDVFIRGINTVRAFAVMPIGRVATASQTNGCAVFPIAIDNGIRSLASGSYPDASDFQYPSSDPPEQGDYFFNLPPETSILNAPEGYLFQVAFNGATDADPSAAPQTFDWVMWSWQNAASGANGLNSTSNSLRWPGDSQGECLTGPGWYHPVLGCGGNFGDDELHAGDPIRVMTGGTTGASNVVLDEFQTHIDLGRSLRVPLFQWDVSAIDELPSGSSGNEARLITHFAIVRPIGYQMNSGSNWMLFEFVRLDNSCGQEIN